MNKKAVSEIIASVFFIIIIIVSISLISFSVLKLINPTLSPELSCVEMKVNPLVTINSVCYNLETKDVEAVIERSNNQELLIDSLDFIVSSDTQREEYTCCEDDCPNCEIVQPGQYKKYYFYTETLGENPQLILKLGDCVIESSKIKNC